MRQPVACLALVSWFAWSAWPAAAQQIDMSQGGSVTVTAAGGIDWDQNAQTVTAYNQARAVRGAVTVDADRLVAFYRKKKPLPGASPAPAPAPAAGGPTTTSGAPDDTGNNEIYRLEAIGHVHIYTATDQAWGDKALYDIDQSVLVLTGHALRLTTPTDVITSRDSMEYWPQIRRSVARGDAILTTTDGRRIQADILVGYSAPNHPTPGAAPAPRAQTVSASVPAGGQQPDPLTSSGKLQKAEAYGDVVVRTQTETVRGERGVYVTDTGIARIVGNVQITRGQNQLNGQAAIVNMRTGLATMTQDPGERVQGLIVPNQPAPAQARPAGGKAAGRHP
jgi:lipopolysaccharide export system protein LptA